jgi:hypothetical protein
MPTDWRLTKKAKRIMGLLNSMFGSAGQANNNIAANNVPVTSSLIGNSMTSGMLGQSQLTTSQAQWNAAQGVIAGSSYPYAVSQYRALHLVVKQVENGYTVDVGGSTHIASDLKEITDLLTNRVAATLLEWNP